MAALAGATMPLMPEPRTTITLAPTDAEQAQRAASTPEHARTLLGLATERAA